MRCAPTVVLAVVSAVVLALPSSALAKPVDQDHPCLGRWVGEGQNSNSPTRWTIDLVMTSAPSGGRCGTIEYTRPTCGGTLEDCRVEGEHDDIHTREAYTHTDGRCAPAGSVIIRCEGETMRYSWIGWERVDTILHRPGGTAPGPTPSTTPGLTPSPTPTPTPNPRPNPSQTPTPTPSPNQTPTPTTPTSEPSGCSCDVAPVPRTAPLALVGLVSLWLAVRRSRRNL